MQMHILGKPPPAAHQLQAEPAPRAERRHGGRGPGRMAEEDRERVERAFAFVLRQMSALEEENQRLLCQAERGVHGGARRERAADGNPRGNPGGGGSGNSGGGSSGGSPGRREAAAAPSEAPARLSEVVVMSAQEHAAAPPAPPPQSSAPPKTTTTAATTTSGGSGGQRRPRRAMLGTSSLLPARGRTSAPPSSPRQSDGPAAEREHIAASRRNFKIFTARAPEHGGGVMRPTSQRGTGAATPGASTPEREA